MMKSIVTIGLIYLLVGCSDNLDTQAEISSTKDISAKKENTEKGGVIPQYQLDALKKAKAVNQLVLDAAEENRKAMATQGL